MSALQDAAKRLAKAATGRSEADVVADVHLILLDGGLDLGNADVRLEAPAPGQRRLDIEVGHTVVEVKKDLTVSGLFDSALEQLTGYTIDRQADQGGRWVGVLTDGREWTAHRLDPNSNELVEFATFAHGGDARLLVLWLDGILATRDNIAPTAATVAEMLGATSSATLLDLSDLRAVYDLAADDHSVQLKRQLWARLLTVASGTQLEETDNVDLFLEHTYLVVMAELIAHEVIGLSIAGEDPEALLLGRAFVNARIGGVVEQDFFDWVIESERGRDWVRQVARRLARFDWADVDHDVLKHLYESVIGPETRHSLGEYYTPDWLARRIVDDVVDDPLEQRVLDPGCGSGTFLFWTIRRILDACDDDGVSNADAITKVTSRVFGIDVHPVAVTLARVTYLLAIGQTRLMGDRPGFSIPVYLGDSVQFDQPDDLFGQHGLVIYVDDGDDALTLKVIDETLEFPNRLVDNVDTFDRLVADLTTAAHDRAPGSPRPSIDGLMDRYSVHPDDRDAVRQTFALLCDLNDDGRNHIWGYYIRNLARPLWLSRKANRVDRLVGNPPWLSYRYMPDRMQDRFKALSTQRGLWAGAKVATQQDLSALFVARTVEQYLTAGGRFGYVMPAAVMTRQAYQGFRTGMWSSETQDGLGGSQVTLDRPWDLAGVTPDIFPVPSCVAFGTRVGNQDYRPLPRAATRLDGDQDAGDFDLTTVAIPRIPTSDADWSPYRDRFRNGATVFPRLLFLVEPQHTSPLGWASGLTPVQSVRTNQEKSPWRDLPSLKGAVEDRFLFNMHLGSTVLPFRTTTPVRIVAPWTGSTMLQPDSSDLSRWPGLQQWWNQAGQMWVDNRAAGAKRSDLRLDGQLDYHGKFTSQASLLDVPRVVYTKAGNTIAAALVTSLDTVIDHKLYWATVSSPDEGHYIVGILNAPITTERVRPLQSKGAFGPRDFDKYIWALDIPLFDPDDPDHQVIVEAATAAQEAALAIDVDQQGFQRARGIIRPRYRNEVVEAGLMALWDMRGWPGRWPWVVLGGSVGVVAAVLAVGGGCRGGRGADLAVSGRAGRLTFG